MGNKPNEYILGLPIESSVGLIFPLKVHEFGKYIPYLSMMGMAKTFIIYQYVKMNKKGELDEFIDQLVDLELYEIVMGIPEFKEAYIVMFEKSLEDKKNIELITYDNFLEIRKLILEINCTSEEIAMINLDKNEPNAYLNLEIQNAIERSKRVKNQEIEDAPEFEDIVSSIVVGTGIDYPVITNWTMYQLYMTYSRIAQFKNYDATTLFATVAPDVKMESWSKHIDLFEKDNHSLIKEKFSKQYGDAVS